MNIAQIGLRVFARDFVSIVFVAVVTRVRCIVGGMTHLARSWLAAMLEREGVTH